MKATHVFSERERLTAKMVLALLAGCVIEVGGTVMALRDAGETIDDGEGYCQTHYDGLFARQRMERYNDGKVVSTEHAWTLVYQGASPRKYVAKVIDGMTDEAVQMRMVGHVFLSSMTPDKALREALLSGMRLEEPPTTILS